MRASLVYPIACLMAVPAAKKSPFACMDDEISTPLDDVSPRHSNAVSIVPPTPDSPWQLSPVHPLHAPAILYQCVACLHRRQGYVYSIAVSRGTVFTGSDSNCIRCWRQPDFTERGSIKSSTGEVHALLSHGTTLFSSHKDNRIRVWTVSASASEEFRAKKLCSLPHKASFLNLPWPSSSQHKDVITCMAYHESEGILYTGSHDKSVKAWRLSDRKCVDTFAAHDAYVSDIMVNQNDGCVFTSSFDGSVKLWRKVFRENTHSLTITLRFQNSPVNALAISNSYESCLLYSALSDGTINFWEKERFSSRYNHGGSLQGHRSAVLCLVAVEDLLFSGSEDTAIRVWRREGRSNYHECLAALEGHRGPVRSLAACFEVDKGVRGILLYSASSDQTLKVWRVNVLPEEKKPEGGDGSKVKGEFDYDISPVLSPSWVEKKTRGTNFPLW